MNFPNHFAFGTSTSAAQIEYATDHDWSGFKARDGTIFKHTTDHESRLEQDLDIIGSLAPNYRMSVLWSRLQPSPMVDFDGAAVEFYHRLFEGLQDRGVTPMLVLHHFANPSWFAVRGGWASGEALDLWLDFIDKLLAKFGHYAGSFNTFNEPNIYVTMAHLLGQFPPRGRNPVRALRVLKNMAQAHHEAVALIRSKCPGKPVGLSINTALLEGENLLGRLPAALSDWWYHEYIPSHFEGVDFFGMSYYARIGYDPLPVTVLHTPEKIAKKGVMHDDMWEYEPSGLGMNIRRFWDRYRLPVIVTENGVCSSDDALRVTAIEDYLAQILGCIQDGIDVRGYYHWSPWDNFEWNLGSSFRFGLYETDPITMDRRKRPSADRYAEIVRTGTISPGGK